MSYTINYQHIVFRTQQSLPTIPEAEKRTLLAYIYRVSEEMRSHVLRLNCYLNHVHLFVDLPADLALSAFVQKVKATSSKAFYHHPQFPQFEGWATGYGSFSKSESDRMKIINYIKGQEEHHRVKSFREELEELFAPDYFRDPYHRRDWLDEAVP